VFISVIFVPDILQKNYNSGGGKMVRVVPLTDEEKRAITEELKNYTLENDLRREVAAAIKRLKEIKCYR
jgi:ribosomal protein S13